MPPGTPYFSMQQTYLPIHEYTSCSPSPLRQKVIEQKERLNEPPFSKEKQEQSLQCLYKQSATALFLIRLEC